MMEVWATVGLSCTGRIFAKPGPISVAHIPVVFLQIFSLARQAPHCLLGASEFRAWNSCTSVRLQHEQRLTATFCLHTALVLLAVLYTNSVFIERVSVFWFKSAEHVWLEERRSLHRCKTSAPFQVAMVRWHDDSCQTPRIYLTEDKWPYCLSCDNACPSVVDLCSRQAAVDTSSLIIPLNERQGRMDLYWPPCVPYFRTRSVRTRSIPNFPEGSQQNVLDSDHTLSLPITLDPTYGITLAATEFRVACLSAPTSENDPIHVSLETYSDDSHPEYETVSYIWGGEDGDNSLRRPIFVGDY